MVCVNLQLCAGLKTDIEGATHTVGQWIMEISRARRIEEESRRPVEEA